LWFIFRRLGAEGLRESLRGHIALASKFARMLGSDPGYEIVAPVHFGLVCFRAVSPADAECDANDWNRRLLDRVNRRGRVFLSHTVIDSRYVIRFSIGGFGATELSVRRVYDELAEAARDVRDGVTTLPT